MITDFLKINTSHEEGKLLMAALVKMTTESQTYNTPNEAMKQLNTLRDEMYF